MPVLSVTTTQASSCSRPMLEAAVSGNANLISFDGECVKGIDLLSLSESEHLVKWCHVKLPTRPWSLRHPDRPQFSKREQEARLDK